MQLFTNLKLFISGALLLVSSLFGIHQSQLGVVAFNPVQAAPSYLSGAGVTGSQTTIPVTSFVTRQGTPITTANLGGIGFATIDPGTSKEENISFTGVTQNANGTAILTGATRGLQDVSPYTASTTLAIAHSGGATVITSNSGAFYSQFNIAANTSTITGAWTFASSSLPSVTSDTPTSSFTTYNLINKQYADALSFAGAPNGNTSTKGIFQGATNAQLASGTSLGSTGANLVPIASSFGTATSSNGVPVTNTSGTLPDAFIGQSALDTYSFLGNLTSASTTLNGTTTEANAPVINAFGTNTSSTVAYGQLAPSAFSGAGYTKLYTQSPASVSASTTLEAVANATLPTIGTSTYYTISGVMDGNNSQAGSSTLSIGGNVVGTYTAPSSLGVLSYYVTVQMLASTTLANANGWINGNNGVLQIGGTLSLTTTTVTFKMRNTSANGTFTNDGVTIMSF